MSKAKKHHLVPRVYLRPWCHENDSVYNLNKESKLIAPKNINNNYDRLNFHSLKASMPILTEEDMQKNFGNEDFNKAYNHIKNIFGLGDIEVPYGDRNKKYLSTMDKEIENDLLPKYYREFLNDKGPIYIMAKEYIRLMTIKFYVASEKLEFVTSDNPSFIMKDQSGKNVHMMAVSPKVLASIGRDIDKSNKYFIEDINDEKVKEINNIIYENAKTDVIMTENTKKDWIKA